METISTISNIMTGKFDDDLNEIKQAIKTRIDYLQQQTLTSMKAGSRFLISASIRPKYLANAPVSVVRVNNTRVVVRIDEDWLEVHPQAKRYSGEVTLPKSLIGEAIG